MAREIRTYISRCEPFEGIFVEQESIEHDTDRPQVSLACIRFLSKYLRCLKNGSIYKSCNDKIYHVKWTSKVCVSEFVGGEDLGKREVAEL